MVEHGMNVRENATSVSMPVVAESGVPFAVGTAPMQAAENPAKINTPVLCTSWDDAVKKLGYSDDWHTYTLCEVMYSHFQLYGCQPIIFCSVLDIAKSKESVAGAEMHVTGKQVTLPIGAIASTLSVKPAADGTELVRGTDYEAYYDGEALIVEVMEDGAAKDAVKLYIAYDKVHADAIGDDEIVKGLDAIDYCMATAGVTPDIIIAPGWSHTAVVQAVMAAKADAISSILRAKCICDIDCSEDGATGYDEVLAQKAKTNLVDTPQIAAWPMIKLGDKVFHLSTQIAGSLAALDSDAGGVPSESPSNKTLKCDGACLADGTDVNLTLEQANILGENGVVTAFRFVNGWVAWGDYNACYPANSDVKDAFINVSRMFRWVGNTLVKTFWSKIDQKMNRLLLDNIKETANSWLAGLVSDGHLLGARVDILESENPDTDLMAGIIRIHVYLTPCSPAKRIDFVLEYDVNYLSRVLS